LLQHYILKVAS